MSTIQGTEDGLVPKKVELHTRTVIDEHVEIMIEFFEKKEGLEFIVREIETEETKHRFHVIYYGEEETMLEWLSYPYKKEEGSL